MQPSFNATGLLGDTPERDYSAKLQSFNAFAERELRQAIASLRVEPGARILDAGCGTGETLPWLLETAGSTGSVTGIDLSAAHVMRARRFKSGRITLIQGDLMAAQLPAAGFDLVWCANTLNHLRNPGEVVRRFSSLLHPGGRLAVGQSAFLPDMYFAWDARLERLTNEAVRQYYRERYGLEERDLTAVRANVGLLRASALQDVQARTFVIERTHPLTPADERYLRDTIFRDTFGERLQPYLSPADHDTLRGLCDPQSPAYALRRPDFHFLQTFTLVTGSAAPAAAKT